MECSCSGVRKLEREGGGDETEGVDEDEDGDEEDIPKSFEEKRGKEGDEKETAGRTWESKSVRSSSRVAAQVKVLVMVDFVRGFEPGTDLVRPRKCTNGAMKKRGYPKQRTTDRTIPSPKSAIIIKTEGDALPR